MAEALKAGVCDLCLELCAHTLGLGCALQAARAIATCHQQALADGRHNFLIRIFLNFHFFFTLRLDFVMRMGYNKGKENI